MKDSALASRLARVAREYVDDDDMLEELGSKTNIERYAWELITDRDQETVIEIALSFMKSYLDKQEFFKFLNGESIVIADLVNATVHDCDFVIEMPLDDLPEGCQLGSELELEFKLVNK